MIVRCGPINPGGYASDPVFVAEVLSPSTMRWDRGGKIEFYQSLPTLQVILVAYQDEYRVEAWSRQAGEWRHAVYRDATDRIPLWSLAGVVTLAEIYDDLHGGA